MSFLGQFVSVEQMKEIRAFIPPRDYNQRKREAEELLARRTVPFREYEIAFPDLQSFPNVCQEDSLVSVLQAWAVTRTVNHMHCVADDIRAVCRQREICGEAKETIMMRVKQHKLYCCVSDSKKLLHLQIRTHRYATSLITLCACCKSVSKGLLDFCLLGYAPIYLCGLAICECQC